MGYILIIGARSDIAVAIAKKYLKSGYNLYLASRGIEDLNDTYFEPYYNDNRIKCVDLDILNYSTHNEIYNSLEEKPIGVIVAVGYLSSQEIVQNNFEEALKVINTNFTGIVSFLNIVASDFERRKKGFIVGISSVAGDRGRKSNYIYGSAKAAFSTYLSGLRNRLCKSNVKVLTVKPGFVKTKMTSSMELPKSLIALPAQVAEDVFKAQQKGKDILYTKFIWKWIMTIINLIPESIFKKMSF